MTNQDVTALFDQWNNALSTGDPKKVTSLYASNATLLPTISNQIRHSHQEIEDYFVQFLETKPHGKLVEQNIKIFDELIINSGIYIFLFKDDSCVTARFSYVYQLLHDEWKIITHHSSRMPE
jgi:uncharacterized protein (TIGR02246 family)